MKFSFQVALLTVLLIIFQPIWIHAVVLPRPNVPITATTTVSQKKLHRLERWKSKVRRAEESGDTLERASFLLGLVMVIFLLLTGVFSWLLAIWGIEWYLIILIAPISVMLLFFLLIWLASLFYK